METAEHAPEQLPDLVVTMIEAVAAAMGCGKGRWRIDFNLADGHLERWTRQQGPAGREALGELVEHGM